MVLLGWSGVCVTLVLSSLWHPYLILNIWLVCVYSRRRCVCLRVHVFTGYIEQFIIFLQSSSLVGGWSGQDLKDVPKTA